MDRAAAIRPRRVHLLEPERGVAITRVDEVLARLAAWRAQTARVARVAPQAVVDDRTLHAIAEARPASVEALTGLPGLGPIKAARFGDGILAALDPS